MSMTLIQKAEAAEAYADMVRRRHSLLVTRDVIAAYEVAADAREEAGHKAAAKILRLWVSEMREVDNAIWSADTEMLDALWPCYCCCHEHTHASCKARMWGGCRGQGVETPEDEAEWVTHYERFHGMTPEEFFGWVG